MKSFKILILLVSFLIFASTVNALVVSSGRWQNNQEIMNINYGESAYFNYIITSDSPPINYNIKMYNSNNVLIKTYIDAITYDYSVGGRYYVTQQDYISAGRYSVEINAIDSEPDFDSAILTLIVNPLQVNHAPILNPIGNKIVNENELLQFTISASDLDNDRLVFSARDLPQDATLVNNNDNTAAFSWQTDFNDAGLYNIRFTVSDNILTDSEDITITVNDVQISHNPVINILRPEENEIISGVYEVRWNAHDLDQSNETLDIKLEYTYNGYDWFTLEDLQNNNDGTFTWNTLTLSNAQDYILRAIVTDDQGNQAQDEANFEINNPHSPQVNFIQPRQNEVISGVYNILWRAVDIDQAQETLDIRLEYREHSGNLFSKILSLFVQDWIVLEDEQNNNDGIFTWDTNNINNGEYDLRIIARDDDNLTATDYVSPFIINNIVTINHAPIIISIPITSAIVNQLYNYDVDAIDEDGDILVYSLKESPSGMNINMNTGLITWIPNQIGTYFVKVVVEDDKNASDSQEFDILVKSNGVIPEPEKRIMHVHEFNISNVILDYNESKLNVYAYLRNSGTEDEKINLRATIMKNGSQEITAFNLENNDNEWKTLTFSNIKKGFYIIKVEAFNSKHYDVRYAYIRI